MSADCEAIPGHHYPTMFRRDPSCLGNVRAESRINPGDALNDILRVLGGARLIPDETRHLGAMVRVTGSVPVLEMRAIEHRVLGLGHGEVSFSSEFLEYLPVVGVAPERARTDVDPRNRAEYLAAVAR